LIFLFFFLDLVKNYKNINFKNENLIVEAVEKCHQIYNNSEAWVIMVVSDFEGNSYDQRFIEFELN
jgi:hypothetical protein